MKVANFALLGLMLAAQGLNVGMLTNDKGFQQTTRLLAGTGTLCVVAIFVFAATQQCCAKYKRCTWLALFVGGTRVAKGSSGRASSCEHAATLQFDNPMRRTDRIPVAHGVKRPSTVVPPREQPSVQPQETRLAAQSVGGTTRPVAKSVI